MEASRNNLRISAEEIGAPARPTGDWRPEEAAQSEASTNTLSGGRTLGWAPALSLVAAAGLLLVAIADTGARNAASWAEPLFWVGLIVIFAPFAARLLSSVCSDIERLSLVVILGLGLYLVKVLYSPLAFNLHDEFLHWRTEIDIANTGHLFTRNPLLPVSSVFPGLEIITSALTSVTGLPFFYSGLIAIGGARIVLVLSLFLLYRRVSGSSQVAGIASLIYMANPNFLFFDAVFSYESMAIALAGLLIFIIARRQGTQSANRLALTAMAVVVMAALIPSHHLTSYIITGLLALWTVIYFVRGRTARDKEMPGPTDLTILAIVLCLLWLAAVAGITVRYLSPDFTGAFNEMLHLVFRDPLDAPRTLFQSSGTGAVTPVWERVTAFASVGVLLAGMAWGLWKLWTRRRVSGAIAIALGVTALAYPVSLAFRLTSRGWEAANRSSEFVFLGLAFVVGLGVGEIWQARRRDWKLSTLLAAGALLVFVGGVIAGWPPEWRLPGPYLIIPTTAGGARTIEIKGISAAEWALAYLGPNSNLGADSSNMLLMGTYGRQNIETTLSGGVNVLWILYSPQLTNDQLTLLKQGKVQYLVADKRFTTAPSVANDYYPGVDIGKALAKFDQAPGVSRVFDDGDIVIYNVEALSREP